MPIYAIAYDLILNILQTNKLQQFFKSNNLWFRHGLDCVDKCRDMKC